jgi:hypothetical protein
MKTYNLGKIELLRNPESQLKGIPSFSKGINSIYCNVSGKHKKKIQAALEGLGFRLPSVKETIYIYNFIKDIKELEYRRFWVNTPVGTEVLAMGIYGDHDHFTWVNAPLGNPYILFAVRDSIPS